MWSSPSRIRSSAVTPRSQYRSATSWLLSTVMIVSAVPWRMRIGAMELRRAGRAGRVRLERVAPFGKGVGSARKRGSSPWTGHVDRPRRVQPPAPRRRGEDRIGREAECLAPGSDHHERGERMVPIRCLAGAGRDQRGQVARGSDGDRADHRQVRGVGRGQLGRKERRVAALRVTGQDDGVVLIRTDERPCRPRRVEDRAPLALADEVGMQPGRAEPFVVRRSDDEPLLRPAVEEVDKEGRRPATRRRVLSARPVVPCAQLRYGCGPSPASSGVAITPLTAIGSPSRPTDRYSTVQSRMPLIGLRSPPCG